jgi:hypothetical protein
MKHKMIAGLALVVALSGCAQDSSKKVDLTVKRYEQKILIPKRYQELKLLSVGYFGADYGTLKGERAPWLSYIDDRDGLVMSYIEDDSWHEIDLRRDELPLQDSDIISAGFFGTDYGILKGERAPWVSFRDKQGNISTYYLEDNKWNETLLINGSP